MARSSNSSAWACAGRACTRSTSASANGAEKTRRATGLIGAAAVVRELFVRDENEVMRHAMKPNIANRKTKNTPTDLVADLRWAGEVNICADACGGGWAETPRGKSTSTCVSNFMPARVSICDTT